MMGFLPTLDFLSLVERLPKSLISILFPFDKLDEKNCNIFSTFFPPQFLADIQISFQELKGDQIYSLLRCPNCKNSIIQFYIHIVEFF